MVSLDKNMKYVCCAVAFLIVIYILRKLLKGPEVPQNQHPQVGEPSVKKNSSKDKVVFFYSESCPHCNNQKKIIENANLTNKFKFIHCPDNQEYCSKNSVEGVPAFMKNGKMVAVGVQNESELKKL
tara:strand:- start:48 stop:425 length:378 start_codon:yes stop_codon:yes gene_type:complete